MANRKLTDKQREILEYLKECILQKGYPPAVREICEAVHLKSTSSVHAHLESLEEKGYIGYKVFGNTHQSYALISEDEYRKKTLKQVVDKYFDNSYTRVVSTLIEEEALTLDELQELIQQIKNK